MDSFTERMLERAKLRQKKLEEHYNNTDEISKTPLQEPNVILKKYENASKSHPNLTECTKMKRKEVVSDSTIYDSALKENFSDSNLTKKGCTRVSSDLQSSPQSPTKTLNIQKENFNMEIKLRSTDNVRVEVEIEERDDSDTDDKNDADKPVMREDVRNRLHRLGKLYSDDDDALSSPIHRTEAKFCEKELEASEKNKKPTAGLGKLKALANTRNQWEDEMSSHTNKTSKEPLKKSWKPPAPKPPTNSTAATFTHSPKKGPAPQPPKSNVSAKIPSREASPEKGSPNKDQNAGGDTKQLPLDNNVLATLESQGFTRTNSNTRLIFNYKDSKKEQITSEDKLETVQDESEDPESEEEVSRPSKSPPKTYLRGGEVLSKAAVFEQNSPSKNTKDPAMMSVSERKALFEKNKGAALVPKAAFGMAAPLKSTDKEEKTAKPLPVKQPKSTKKLNNFPAKHFPQKSENSPNKTKTNVLSPTKAFIAESGGIASKMRALLEKKSTISQSQIAHNIKEQRQKDMDLLLNRFNKNKNTDEIAEESSEEEEEENVGETTKMIQNRAGKIIQFKGEMLPPPPPPPPTVEAPQPKSGAPKRRSKGDSPKVREVLDDIKRIKVTAPKVGRMYPCLSDIEASNTENEQGPSTAEQSSESSFEENNSSYTDSEEPNTSFGREILEVVCKNQTPQKRPILDDSTASDLSDILDGMDDYLDEALAQDSDNTEGPTPPKHGRSTPPKYEARPSNSFHYSSTLKYDSPSTPNSSKQSSVSSLGQKSPGNYSSPKKYSPKKSTDVPSHIVDGESVLPLIHTVSFYRKQQAQGNKTPVRQITRQTALEEESSQEEEQDESIEVSEKIQELMNNVTKQQTVISQASQALNLCCSTIEFSGSSEQVEAERLLLVATQRRQAALHEVQRLRVEGTLHPGGGNFVDKGSLIISDIYLPLKKEYVRALAAAGGQGHHVVCLIRYAEHVIPTRLVSTVASPKDGPEINLRIPGIYKLENIFSDFTITFEVYSLQAQEELLPHEVKYHINTKKGGKSTPKKKDSKLIMPSIQSPAGPQAVRSPSFALMGYVIFSLQAVNRTHWTLNNAPALSPLEGSIQMRVNCELAVSVEHRGFLTMFEDISGFGAWHRRWCLLKGHSLSYWKYPDDERKKAPIDTINLKICTTKNVGQVSRDICARPHTFLLETMRDGRSSDKDSLVTVCRGDKTMIRHLLSADTKEERIEWCEKFNKALESTRLWGKN